MKKLKLTKLNNKELIENALSNIEKETRFHITRKEFGDGYFIFERGKNSVCWFWIKEIPGFRFAFWRIDDTYEYFKDPDMKCRPGDELIFFCQYEINLDKFKPSRSGFVSGCQRKVFETSENSYDYEEGLEPTRIIHYDFNNTDEQLYRKEIWYMDDIIDSLQYMKKHHMKSVYYSSFNNINIWNEITNWIAFREYIRLWYYHIKYSIRDNRAYKKQLKHALRFCKEISKYNYNVLCEDDHCCSPRLHIRVRPSKKTTDQDYIKAEKLYDKFEEKWFNTISLEYMSRSDDKVKDRHIMRWFYNKIKKYQEKGQIWDDTNLIYLHKVDVKQ